MFHGLKPMDFFAHFPLLVFIEATIYQMDEQNEDYAAQGESLPGLVLDGERALLAVLEHEGLVDDAVLAELESGRNYWKMEREICSRLLALRTAQEAGLSRDRPKAETFSESKKSSFSGPVVPPLISALRSRSPGSELSWDECLSVARLKSFDYRLLNLIMYKITKTERDQKVLDFLLLNELLVDLHDDLCDYEDDILRNSFNLYRLAVACHGKQAPYLIIERIAKLEEAHEQALSQLPLSIREHFIAREAEAMESGANKWTVPSPIINESKFCKDVAEEGAKMQAHL